MTKNKNVLYRIVGIILIIIVILRLIQLIFEGIPADFQDQLHWIMQNIIILALLFIVGYCFLSKYKNRFMNFKPTAFKAILSIIIFFIVDLFLSFQFYCFPIPGGSCGSYDNILLGSPLIFVYSLIIAVIVYVVLGFFQKKNTSSKLTILY